jgi:hypothetical protein
LEERRRNESYVRVKLLAQRLEPMGEFGRNIFTRAQEAMQVGKVYEYDQDKADLVLAMAEVRSRANRVLPAPESAFREIVRHEPYPVESKAREILSRLKEQGITRFLLLFKGNRSRSEIVATFLAVLELCRMNHAKGWVQQFHFGPIRNVNTRMFKKLGPDTGFDTIGDYRSAESIAQFLNALDVDSQLAKTILYNINPAENMMIAAMIANFQDGSIPGKIQFGSGWWFNDQIEGMEQQMNALSLQGLLSRFVGMLTDSRSFVSYPRHEYFRRILCNLIGKDVEAGLIPESEMSRVEAMVEDICYRNAVQYFNF